MGVTQISIKDQIKKLVDLQKIDAEIYNVQAGLTEKPALIEESKKKFESAKANLNQLEEKFKGIQLKRKGLELEMKSKEDDIVKANTQLTQLKTNKEYQVKLNEIVSIKADQSIFEEKILLSYDEADGIQGEIGKEKVVVAAQEKQYLARKKEIEDEIKLMEDRVNVLESQRKQLLPDVDRTLLNRYEKILAHKDGLGIAPLNGTSCGGCHMNVPQQTINAIKMHDQLIECEICQRIMYLEDDL